MKHTYERTMFIENLAEATVKLYITEQPKWKSWTRDREVEYKGVTSWDIIEGGEEAAEIEADLGDLDFDEAHTYLVLHFVLYLLISKMFQYQL